MKWGELGRSRAQLQKPCLGLSALYFNIPPAFLFLGESHYL